VSMIRMVAVSVVAVIMYLPCGATGVWMGRAPMKGAPLPPGSRGALPVTGL